MRISNSRRLHGIKQIVTRIDQTQLLLSYLLFRFRNKLDAGDNSAFIAVTQILFENSILNFHKLIIENEKHSFSKLLNSSNKNKSVLRDKLEKLQLKYLNEKFDQLRNTYLAHLDFNDDEFYTDSNTVLNFSSHIIEYYKLVCLEFEFGPDLKSEEFSNSIETLFNNYP